MNVSRELLSKIENGTSPYLQQYVEGLARLYLCSPADLLCQDPRNEQGNPDEILKAALLVYGVHASDVGSALKAIKGFVSESDVEQ